MGTFWAPQAPGSNSPVSWLSACIDWVPFLCKGLEQGLRGSAHIRPGCAFKEPAGYRRFEWEQLYLGSHLQAVGGFSSRVWFKFWTHLFIQPLLTKLLLCVGPLEAPGLAGGPGDPPPQPSGDHSINT